jgi:Zn-dependent protease
MFGEPPSTQYDWNFQLFGIPVRVHPFFWLLSLMLGMRGNTSQGILIWVSVVFVSILVHELGHAVVIRYFGWSPRIVLHSFGGLAIYDPNFAPSQSGQRPRRTGSTQILISLAGPAAGFAFATLIVILLHLTQRAVDFPLFGNWITIGSGAGLTSIPMRTVVFDLLQVNIYWGILNLMPIYPLDGGQVARELFISNSRDGVRKSLQLSLAAAAVLAVLSFIRFGQPYMALMFGYMAYMNYQQVKGPFGSGFGGNRPW